VNLKFVNKHRFVGPRARSHFAISDDYVVA